MKHYLGEQPPDKCSHNDWLDTMAKNVTNSIKGYIEAGFTEEEAIARTRADSCAGRAVWNRIFNTN